MAFNHILWDWYESKLAEERELIIVSESPDILFAGVCAFVDQAQNSEELKQIRHALAHGDELREARTYSLGQYNVIVSGPHSAGGKKHAHVELRGGEQLWSVNVDNTGHDGYHGTRMEKQPYEFLLEKGFKLSKDRYIESTDDSRQYFQVTLQPS